MLYENLPNYLVIRFAPGAAGNMIASLLQCSQEVAHWNQDEQHKKPHNDWLAYFKKVFPTEINKWLYHEPVGQLNWGTRTIFSAKYDRGNNLSIEEFLAREKIHCNNYYHEQKKNGRMLPIFWHKKFQPCYFSNSRSIAIRLDQKSLRWFDHAVYKKHYQIVKTTNSGILVRLLENRPEIVLPDFQNVIDFEREWPSFRDFVREMIVNNPLRSMYQDSDFLSDWTIPVKIIDLSSLLSTERIHEIYIDLCEFLAITPALSKNVVQKLHRHWRNLHSV